MKDIKGYEGYYMATECGKIYSVRKLRFMKGGVDGWGYRRVTLIKDGAGRGYTVHRLIASTFIPNPENKRCVNHKNGIKTDNRVENLEWCTHSENILHAYTTGLKSGRGPTINRTKTREPKTPPPYVFEIRRKVAEGKSYKSVASEYNISCKYIRKIVSGEKWKHSFEGDQKIIAEQLGIEIKPKTKVKKDYTPYGGEWEKSVSKLSKFELINMLKRSNHQREELSNCLRKVSLSMYAHPDCQPNSEFMDYVEMADELLKDNL